MVILKIEKFMSFKKLLLITQHYYYFKTAQQFEFYTVNYDDVETCCSIKFTF